jgi:hypothetical protein
MQVEGREEKGITEAGKSKDEGSSSHYLREQKRCWIIENLAEHEAERNDQKM